MWKANALTCEQRRERRRIIESNDGEMTCPVCSLTIASSRVPLVPVRSIQSCKLRYGRFGFTVRNNITISENVKRVFRTSRRIREVPCNQWYTDPE